MTPNKTISDILISWWRANKTLYPWRLSEDENKPYHVWLSEVMLQQTTVATVCGYFERFIQKWPRLEDLSHTSLEEVFVLWQGLGYYSRARNLHKASKILQQNFPKTQDELIKIPGIGPYTSAAIASIAFNNYAVVVDGNVKRVVSRLFGIENDIDIHAKKITPFDFPGDYAQSIMDFGRFICKPTSPNCLSCPLQDHCYAFKTQTQSLYPIKKKKPQKQKQYAVAFVATDPFDQCIFIQTQTDKKLLQDLMTVPMTPWMRDQEWEEIDALKYAPFHTNWVLQTNQVKHEFTHISLCVKVFKGILKEESSNMVNRENLKKYALSTLVKKIINN